MTDGASPHRHERVLVVSVDGLAPRAVGVGTAPRLCALARSGAACWTARTVIPPITVPAHASMFHGIEPGAHGLVDNTPLSPRGGSASFLAAASAAGRSTASVLCWLPLDGLVEPDAAGVRITIDSGYDPLDDDLVTGHVCDLLRRPAPDVTLAYLVACDLAGHAHGWDSPEYAAAVRRSDELLGRMIDAAGPDTAIVVTTDHGGSGRGHADPVPDTMATFVVARSARLVAGSMWSAASILDIAPTVADLAGVAAHPAWAGRSLIGGEQPVVGHLLALAASMADHTYGERVDMLSHALQAADRARSAGASDSLVLAALLHDLGHLLGEPGAWGIPDHAEIGARSLQGWLPPEVVEPIRLHVAAKRWLVATDPGYVDGLSAASIATLAEQGGPFGRDEADEFAARPFAADAVLLRRWDDAGKVGGSAVTPLRDYEPLLLDALSGA